MHNMLNNLVEKTKIILVEIKAYLFINQFKYSTKQNPKHVQGRQ